MNASLRAQLPAAAPRAYAVPAEVNPSAGFSSSNYQWRAGAHRDDVGAVFLPVVRRALRERNPRSTAGGAGESFGARRSTGRSANPASSATSSSSDLADSNLPVEIAPMIRPVQPSAAPSHPFEADALREKVSRLRAILAEAVPANAEPEHTMSLATQLRWHERRSPAGRDWSAAELPRGMAVALLRLDRQAYALSSVVDLLRAHDNLEQTVPEEAMGHYVAGGLFECACLLADQQSLLLEEIAELFPEVSR